MWASSSKHSLGNQFCNKFNPPSTVAGRLSGGELLKVLIPIADSRFPLPSMVLRHLFQHGRCVPSCAMNATSLEMIGITILISSKRCEGLKKKGGYEQSNRRDLQ
ncbi:hypothetical protein M9H77_31713 [Catharanthus roseus]|uniref:Uncharacterized protein n=1 Tax=Catharanthus roseus TaxID=4058 RepID=A0ACC0A4R0_CATRO|nr:hypothetical protein M9H77_31713 [Catharanthus roseus]